jgi:hypothetical protein
LYLYEYKTLQGIQKEIRCQDSEEVTERRRRRRLKRKSVVDVKSFSFVCTAPCHREALLLVLSIRRHYSCPIFILSDSLTESFLSKFQLGGLLFRRMQKEVLINKALEGIKTQNSFHNKAAIYRKMDVMDWAIRDTGNTFFLDADIVLKDEIHQAITHPVMLSPHHYMVDPQANRKFRNKYGGFNAGYLFASEKGFGDEWKNIYLNRSDFYEQEGMSLLFELYDIGKFDETHNVGFWRYPIRVEKQKRFLEVKQELGPTKSFHCHFDRNSYQKADAGLRQCYDIWADICRPYLPPELKMLTKEFKNTS